MKKGVNLTEIVDLNNNIIDFSAEKSKRLATASGGGDEENWLSNLEVGSVFTARQRVPKGQIRPWLCSLYFLREKGELSSCVRCAMPDGKSVVLWVHTLDFSRQNEYVETVAILEIDPELANQEIKREEEKSTNE